MSRHADAHTRALMGMLVRARQRFDTGALARLTPHLGPQETAAAIGQEQEYARAWERKARERVHRRQLADPGIQTSLAMLPRERAILTSHLAMTGARMTARSDIAKLRAAGETHGYWMRSDRPWNESCEECQALSGRLWPLDFLERYGPPRHPNCGCKVISRRAALAWGLPFADPIPLREALREAFDERAHPRAKSTAGTNDGSFCRRRGRPRFPNTHPPDEPVVRSAANHYGGVRATSSPRPPAPKGTLSRADEDKIAAAIHRMLGLTVYEVESAARQRKANARALAAVTEASAGVLSVVDRLQEDARADGMNARAAEQFARVLREATVPVWRAADHPRWPKGHPLGGQFRRKVDIGAIPNALKPGLAAMSRAAEKGDIDAVDRAYDAMVKAARRLRGYARGDALRAAARARAGVLNPRGLRIPTGSMIDVGDGQRVPVPLGVPSLGVYGPWAELTPFRSVFMWEMAPGELGPDHDGLVHAMRNARSLLVTDLPNGGVRVQSAEGRTEAQANGDARRLEILAPQLRATRVSAPGVDLADTTPLDPHPDEGVEEIENRYRTWYPGVSTRMLGDTAENVIDAAATRMRDLGLLGADDRVEFPSLASPDRNAPLDWVLGERGIEVKAQSMRSLAPGVQQRASTIDSGKTRADKIAAVTRRGLRPSLVHALTDLDNDVVHLMLHDYPDPDTMFKEIRPPQALIDRLVAGTLRPGDDETATTGKHAGRGAKRFIYLGTFRLAYNPYLARLDTEPDLNATRRRAAAKAPVDVGVRAPVTAPIDRPTGQQAGLEAVIDKRQQLEERNARIEAMYHQNVDQDEIGKAFGITQARVSQILSARGVQTRRGKKKRAPGVGSDHLPRAASTHRRGGGSEFDPGQFVSDFVRKPVRSIAGRGRGRRAALRREALAHQSAGLTVQQIAKKMGRTVDYIMLLLAEPGGE